MDNKEQALQLMDMGFGFLDEVRCKGEDLDNMAKARELLRQSWELFHAPDEESAGEVKQDG